MYENNYFFIEYFNQSQPPNNSKKKKKRINIQQSTGVAILKNIYSNLFRLCSNLI